MTSADESARAAYYSAKKTSSSMCVILNNNPAIFSRTNIYKDSHTQKNPLLAEDNALVS